MIYGLFLLKLSVFITWRHDSDHMYRFYVFRDMIMISLPYCSVMWSSLPVNITCQCQNTPATMFRVQSHCAVLTEDIFNYIWAVDGRFIEQSSRAMALDSAVRAKFQKPHHSHIPLYRAPHAYDHINITTGAYIHM